MHIKSDRLVVTLDSPNQGWASNNRFDRTATVVSVVLDGKHTFTTPEVLNTDRFTTGGMGLMAEFLWPEPIDAAQAGERYHKIGVGMVQRGAQEVTMVNAFTADCIPNEAFGEQQSEQVALFCSKAPLLNGWAYSIQRRASVQGNRLTIEATLINEGEKPIEALEYNHNFVNIDDRPIGPDYRIELSYDLADAERRGALRRENRLYTLAEAPTSPFFMTTDGIGDAPEYGWTMRCGGSPATMSETVSEKPARTAMWGIEHVASVEIFLPIDIAPGQRKTWTREWTFCC